MPQALSLGNLHITVPPSYLLSEEISIFGSLLETLHGKPNLNYFLRCKPVYLSLFRACRVSMMKY